jgi:hypothetical protein
MLFTFLPVYELFMSGFTLAPFCNCSDDISSFNTITSEMFTGASCHPYDDMKTCQQFVPSLVSFQKTWEITLLVIVNGR